MIIRSRFTGEILREIEDFNLSGDNLSGADLSGADLSGANLSGANLSGANLTGADLSGADLSGADLSGANLSGDNLSGADLSGADLSGANLSGANLTGANLRDATINWQNHDLIARILMNHADSLDREMVAGWILISRHRCWNKFLEMRHHPEFPWAIETLRGYVKPDDGAPGILTHRDTE